MRTCVPIALALLSGCAGYGMYKGPALEADGDTDADGIPAVELFVGASSLASPVTVHGAVLPDGPTAIEWVQLLGRRVTPLTTDFSSFEITFDARTLETAARDGQVLLQPTVKVFRDATPHVLRCGAGAAGAPVPSEDSDVADTDASETDASDTLLASDSDIGALDTESGGLSTLDDTPLCWLTRDGGEVGPCSCVVFALDGRDPTLDDVDTTELVGRVFEVDLSSGRFARPMQFDPIFRQLTVDYGLLLKVVAFDAATQRADLLGAFSWRGRQSDRPTFAFEGDEAMSLTENPKFAVEGVDLDVPLSGSGTLPMQDVSISGTLTADGLRAVDIQLEGLVDAKSLEGYGLGADTFCAVLGLDGVEDCGPCPSGDSNSCFRVTVEGAVAEATDADVVERAEVAP